MISTFTDKSKIQTINAQSTRKCELFTDISVFLDNSHCKEILPAVMAASVGLATVKSSGSS